jgi:hypothetical protein
VPAVIFVAVNLQLLLTYFSATIQQLEKAAQMAMNMNLLLQQEIKVLRVENERKNKEEGKEACRNRK